MNYLLKETRNNKDFKRKKICNIMLNVLEIKNKEICLKSKPINLSVCLTNKCNARCKYCNVYNEQWEISYQTKEEIIKLLPFLDCISWSGGEVFLYKYFRELFTFAKKCDVRQQIVTNGMLLDEEWIKQIITSNTKLAISIRSTEKEKYEYLTEGARYNKLITNLRNIKKHLYKRNQSFELSMYVLVTKYNYMELEKLIDFAKEYNFDTVRFIQLDNSANPINDENICSNDSKYYKPLKNELNKALEKARKYGIGINCELSIDFDKNKIINYGNKNDDYYYLFEEYKNIKGNQLFCIFPWTSLIIINEGFFVFNHFCKINKEYNYSLSNNTILEYWNSKEVLDFREKIKRNDYNNICSSVCTKYNIHMIY
jgi:MoaA/NifB/PqqE/SkfB family radical SAM enzyme